MKHLFCLCGAALQVFAPPEVEEYVERVFWEYHWGEGHGVTEKQVRKCWLEKHGSCCCECKFRLRALDHETDESLGYACVAFMEWEDIAYVGDFEHGMCELFTRREV